MGSFPTRGILGGQPRWQLGNHPKTLQIGGGSEHTRMRVTDFNKSFKSCVSARTATLAVNKQGNEWA